MSVDIKRIITENKFDMTHRNLYDGIYHTVAYSFNEQERDIFVLFEYLINKNGFVIDFDDYIQWIGTTKQRANTLLRKECIENQGYSVINNKVVFTGEAFKRMCMVANTERSKYVNNYFSKMQKILFSKLEKEIHEIL